MDKERFAAACDAAAVRVRSGIGTMSEKGIHNTLKNYFEPHSENHEISIGGYIADIVGESGIIEIQTRSFYRMRKKLEAFLEAADVSVVYPAVVEKTIIKLGGEDGEVQSIRKSPKHASEWDVFEELYAIRDMLGNPRLNICIVLITANEIRNGETMKRGRKRAVVSEKLPTSLVDEIWLRAPCDYARFLPQGMDSEFTSGEFARLWKIPVRTARYALPVLCAVGLCEHAGKSGRSNLYRAKAPDSR